MPSPYARLASWATILSLLIAPGVASADVPTGSFEFDFGGTNSVWINVFDSTGGSVGLCGSYGRGTFDSVESCRFMLVIDGKGKLAGFADIVGRREGTSVFLHGPLKGAQRGDNRSGITRVSFEVELERSIFTGGFGANGFIGKSPSLAFDGMLDAAGVITGTWALKVCPFGIRCTTTRFPASRSTWPPFGQWSLALEIEDLGAGVLEGVAQVLFGDLSTCEFTVNGLYNAKKDVANLALSPISPECAGTSLRLRNLTRREGSLDPTYSGQIQYKLFGVSGITAVETGIIALQRVDGYFHYPTYPPFQPPQTGSSTGSVSMVMTVVQMPSAPLLQPSASSSASASEIAAAEWNTILYLVSAQQGGAPPAAAGAGGAVDIMEGMTNSILFQFPASTTTNLVQPGVTPPAP